MVRRGLELSAGTGDQPSTPTGGRQRERAVELPPVLFKPAGQSFRVIDLAQTDEGLHLVGDEGEYARFPQPHLTAHGDGRGEPPVRRRKVAL
jgi:hypothetical protein